jgi:hypothetical protein
MIRITTTPSWHETAKLYHTIFLAASLVSTGFGLYLAWHEAWANALLLFGFSVVLLVTAFVISAMMGESQREMDDIDRNKKSDELNERISSLYEEIDGVRKDLNDKIDQVEQNLAADLEKVKDSLDRRIEDNYTDLNHEIHLMEERTGASRTRK